MVFRLAIARPYAGEPLERVAVWISDGLIYTANPDSIRLIEAGRSDPVGFPEGDVSEYDDGSYERLRDHWSEKAAPIFRCGRTSSVTTLVSRGPRTRSLAYDRQKGPRSLPASRG